MMGFGMIYTADAPRRAASRWLQLIAIVIIIGCNCRLLPMMGHRPLDGAALVNGWELRVERKPQDAAPWPMRDGTAAASLSGWF